MANLQNALQNARAKAALADLEQMYAYYQYEAPKPQAENWYEDTPAAA